MRNMLWLAAGLFLGFLLVEFVAWREYWKQECARTRVLEEAEETAATEWDYSG